MLLPEFAAANPCSAFARPVLIYAKQENEDYFHPLHLVPPTLVGLAMAVSVSS